MKPISEYPKWEQETIERLRHNISAETYTDDDGALRWNSNDSVIGISTFEEADMTAPPAQAAARERHVDVTVAAYRERMKNHVPDAEELYEMRAAFGEGTEVVNAITGKVTKL